MYSAKWFQQHNWIYITWAISVKNGSDNLSEPLTFYKMAPINCWNHFHLHLPPCFSFWCFLSPSFHYYTFPQSGTLQPYLAAFCPGLGCLASMWFFKLLDLKPLEHSWSGHIIVLLLCPHNVKWCLSLIFCENTW